jgi:hypothetical protein
LKFLTADSDFLHEVNSIPKEIRKKYIQKLQRGNLGGQKNFLFASHVEKILSAGINEWDRNKILRVLKISPAMLSCYKCRMLKKLRGEYFGVKKEKKETDIDFAKRLSALGMNREAKKIYLALLSQYESELTKKNFKNFSGITNIYSWLCLYYFNLKNYRRFCIYRKRLISLNKFSSRINSHSRNTLRLNIYKVESFKYNFRLSGDKAQKASYKYKTKALEYSKRCKDTESRMLLLFQMGVMQKVNRNFLEAEKLLNEGLKLSGRLKQNEKPNDDKILFEIQLGEIRFAKDNSYAQSYFDYLSGVKNKFSVGKSSAAVLQYALFNLMKLSGFLNLDDELQSSEQNYLNWLFICSRRYEAYLRKIGVEVVWLGWEMIEWHQNKGRYEIKINKEKQQKYFNILGVFAGLSRKVYNVNRLFLLYNYQFESEVYRGNECNFAAAQLFHDKLHRIYRTRKMQIPESWFKLNGILIKMLEEAAFTDKEKVYHKYSLSLKEIVDSLKSKEYKYNVLGEYSKMNFISNIFKVKAFTDEVFAFEDWLKENRPNLFDPVNLNLPLTKSA